MSHTSRSGSDRARNPHQNRRQKSAPHQRDALTRGRRGRSNFNPSTAIADEMPVSDVNVLSVNCRPYWIIASYLINIFISIVSPSSGYAWASQTLISEGTYVAMC